MKIIDMHEALLEQGFDIGYTTVRNYVREKEKTRTEAFIRAIYEPGVVCEFDWGEVKLEIGGRLKTYQLAVFTMAYSNYHEHSGLLWLSSAALQPTQGKRKRACGTIRGGGPAKGIQSA